MKHTNHSKTMRLLRVVLLVTMLTTSGTFAMYANELPVIVNNFVTSSQNTPAASSSSGIIPDETFALMQRINEFDTFTEEEKERVLEVIGMGYDNDGERKEC